MEIRIPGRTEAGRVSIHDELLQMAELRTFS